jgi:hypothetical protein
VYADDQKDRPQGRSEREAESYNASYGEALSDARTKRAVFFSILLRIDVLLKYLAWPKRHDSAGGNPNFFSSSRISSFTGSLAAHDKISKPRDFDRFSLLQNGLQQIQDKLNDISGFIFRDADLLENFVSDIRLSHTTPLRDHCNSPRFA